MNFHVFRDPSQKKISSNLTLATPWPAFRSSSPPGPEQNLAVGNLDPLRARRRPGRVRMCRAFPIF